MHKGPSPIHRFTLDYLLNDLSYLSMSMELILSPISGRRLSTGELELQVIIFVVVVEPGILLGLEQDKA